LEKFGNETWRREKGKGIGILLSPMRGEGGGKRTKFLHFDGLKGERWNKDSF